MLTMWLRKEMRLQVANPDGFRSATQHIFQFGDDISLPEAASVQAVAVDEERGEVVFEVVGTDQLYAGAIFILPMEHLDQLTLKPPYRVIQEIQARRAARVRQLLPQSTEPSST